MARFVMMRAWFVIKYRGVIYCFLQNKNEEEKMREGEKGGYMLSYNLDINDKLTDSPTSIKLSATIFLK